MKSLLSLRARVTSLLVGIVSVCLLLGWNDEVGQPIAYNHKVHVEDLEIACNDCHSRAETHSRALIPNIEVCGACHVDTEAENETERQVALFVEQSKPIPWRQIHRVPDHAFFSHRRHVKLGELECELCHGDVTKMEQAFIEPYVSIDMDWCIDCHDQRGVTHDCYSCHR